jgi:hypothetical protein
MKLKIQYLRGSSFTDYLQGVNLEELLSDFPGNVQNNTCNNKQCNHNTFTRPQIVYGNVTIIHNLTVSKP